MLIIVNYELTVVQANSCYNFWHSYEKYQLQIHVKYIGSSNEYRAKVVINFATSIGYRKRWKTLTTLIFFFHPKFGSIMNTNLINFSKFTIFYAIAILPVYMIYICCCMSGLL
jgi:hypothetical protein